MEAKEMREVIKKMGWSTKYYDNTPWHPEVVIFNDGAVDLYGVDDARTDEYILLNSQDAEYFCTVQKEDDKNVRVDKGDEEYIPLLEIALPQYHYYVK